MPHQAAEPQPMNGAGPPNSTTAHSGNSRSDPPRVPSMRRYVDDSGTERDYAHEQ
jgi:hypothetical protein